MKLLALCGDARIPIDASTFAAAVAEVGAVLDGLVDLRPAVCFETLVAGRVVTAACETTFRAMCRALEEISAHGSGGRGELGAGVAVRPLAPICVPVRGEGAPAAATRGKAKALRGASAGEGPDASLARNIRRAYDSLSLLAPSASATRALSPLRASRAQTSPTATSTASATVSVSSPSAEVAAIASRNKAARPPPPPVAAAAVASTSPPPRKGTSAELRRLQQELQAEEQQLRADEAGRARAAVASRLMQQQQQQVQQVQLDAPLRQQLKQQQQQLQQQPQAVPADALPQLMVWGVAVHRGAPIPFSVARPPRRAELARQIQAVLRLPESPRRLSFCSEHDGIEVDLDDDDDVAALANVARAVGMDFVRVSAHADAANASVSLGGDGGALQRKRAVGAVAVAAAASSSSSVLTPRKGSALPPTPSESPVVAASFAAGRRPPRPTSARAHASQLD